MTINAKRLRRYALFGAGGLANTAISYAVFLAANLFIPYQIAYLIAYAIGIVFSYVYNSRAVFGVQLSLKGMTAWPLVYLFQYLAGAVLLGLLVEWTGVSENFAPLMVAVVMVPVTYMLSRLVLSATGSDTTPSQPHRP